MIKCGQLVELGTILEEIWGTIWGTIWETIWGTIWGTISVTLLGKFFKDNSRGQFQKTILVTISYLFHAHDLLDVHVRPVDDAVVHIGGRGHHIIHTHGNSFNRFLFEVGSEQRSKNEIE